MALVEVKVPDIGDFKDVEVIELLVKPGDAVKVEQSLITVESDKASMEIPSSHAGVVKEMKIKLGDKVGEGSLLLVLEADAAAAVAAAAAPAPAAPAAAAPAPHGSRRTGRCRRAGGHRRARHRRLRRGRGDRAAGPAGRRHQGRAEPDHGRIGQGLDGDSVVACRGAEGAEGQDRRQGVQGHAHRRAAGLGCGGGCADRGSAAAAPAKAEAVAAPAPREAAAAPAAVAAHQPTAPSASLPHASPSIRRFARELGVPLEQVKGSGPKGRITQQDVQGFVKSVIAQASAPKAAAPAAAGGGIPGLLPWPQVDFAKFGPVERKDLSRIKKISGANLHRNWVLIPHVTNNDEADITELEALRVQLNKENEKSGVKLTMLAFVIKAVVAALKKFPDFNASLDGDALVYKQYFHIGFAADTPNGLVVPVLKDADKKGLLQIATEMGELSKKARDGKMGPADMSGGCFSISSLGGIGGTHFTPIINAPEVAILGLSKGYQKPVWDGKTFVPRLTLPLSLSYDHRVIDGASAARFNAYLGSVLADFRRVLL